MKIYVEMMSFIRRPNNISRTFNREIDESLTIEEFLKHLGFTSDEIRIMQLFISKVSDKENNERTKRNYILQDNDYLFITLPIGGGL